MSSNSENTIIDKQIEVMDIVDKILHDLRYMENGLWEDNSKKDKNLEIAEAPKEKLKNVEKNLREILKYKDIFENSYYKKLEDLIYLDKIGLLVYKKNQLQYKLNGGLRDKKLEHNNYIEIFKKYKKFIDEGKIEDNSSYLQDSSFKTRYNILREVLIYPEFKKDKEKKHSILIIDDELIDSNKRIEFCEKYDLNDKTDQLIEYLLEYNNLEKKISKEERLEDKRLKDEKLRDIYKIEDKIVKGDIDVYFWNGQYLNKNNQFTNFNDYNIEFFLKIFKKILLDKKIDLILLDIMFKDDKRGKQNEVIQGRYLYSKLLLNRYDLFANIKLFSNATHSEIEINKAYFTKEKLRILLGDYSGGSFYLKGGLFDKTIENLDNLFNNIRSKFPKSSILIEGKTGTGKTHIVKEIAKKYNQIFRHLNIVEYKFIESELFGNKEGAFTDSIYKEGALEMSSGILFIDEVGEIPLEVQSKLLLAIEERKFAGMGEVEKQRVIGDDVVIIFATNKNLKQMVEDGVFREDLYWRISNFEIKIPTLEQRFNSEIVCDGKDEIDIILESIINKIQGVTFDKNSLYYPFLKKLIKKMEWRGNFREFERVVNRAVINLNNRDGKDLINSMIDQLF